MNLRVRTVIAVIFYIRFLNNRPVKTVLECRGSEFETSLSDKSLVERKNSERIFEERRSTESFMIRSPRADAGYPC